MAANKVIAGAYQGKNIGQTFGSAYLQIGLVKTVFLKEIVSNYEILDTNSRKSASSAVLRGALGAALLGPVGLLAGLSAKNKNSKVIALKLPKLPSGFSYGTFAISGSYFYAAWEESEFYEVGKSGFICVNLDKILSY